MATVIAKNNTVDDITLIDLNGVVILGSGQKTLSDIFTEAEMAASDDLITKIASEDITVNNGTEDMTVNNAIRFISLYKHINPISADGKEIIRADSRPPTTQTYFTCESDDVTSSPGKIGEGNRFFWDFSNSDNDLDESPIPSGQPIPEGYKRKRIEAQFHDPLYLKDGTFYWMNATKGSYLCVHVVCPDGQYYLNRSGIPIEADGDTVVETFVNKHFFAGDCPMGDEVNAEGAQVTPMPTNYKMWLDITVPDSDNTSYGWASLECYRSRSVLLPGELP